MRQELDKKLLIFTLLKSLSQLRPLASARAWCVTRLQDVLIRAWRGVRVGWGAVRCGAGVGGEEEGALMGYTRLQLHNGSSSSSRTHCCIRLQRLSALVMTGTPTQPSPAQSSAAQAPLQQPISMHHYHAHESDMAKGAIRDLQTHIHRNDPLLSICIGRDEETSSSLHSLSQNFLEEVKEADPGRARCPLCSKPSPGQGEW